MDARIDAIDAWLAPAHPNVIRRSVGMVRGLMASAASGDVATVLDGYVIVLGNYPASVVEDVCRRFLDGRLGNRVYAPTPAEIAHECRLGIADAMAERGRIRAVLDAEVYSTPSPEEQAKIQAEYRRFVAEATRAAKPTAIREHDEPAGIIAAERLQAARNLTEQLATLKLKREEREAEADRKSRITQQAETEGRGA